MRLENLEGQRFGRWRVVSYAGKSKHNVVCDCGTERTILTCDLKSGHSKSCGCWSAEASHVRKTTHGMTRTPEYIVWVGLRGRCNNKNNPKYEGYGGRGITVDERWDTFEVFLRDMGPKPSPEHSVERIDNDEGYLPENCRWATPVEQANNRRSNVFLEHNGQSKTVAQWAMLLGVRADTIKQRIRYGWPVERALTQPTKGITT